VNKINRIIFIGCVLGIFFLGSIGTSLCEESHAVVNLMIDADIPASPSPEETKSAGDSLINLVNGIDPRGLNATIFVSGDMVSAYRLGITLQGTMSNHELALYGNNSGESLSSLSGSEQKAALTRARDKLYSCYVCGGKHVDIKGFRPQGFDQNEDTFPILENLGIVYDAGFQSGLIYTPGHENDAWPYPIDGYKLYAVPVSTYPFEGVPVYLYDRYAKEEKKLSGSQWYDLLVGSFDESAEAGEPMVVIFSNLVSGDGEYLDAYRNFLDYAQSKGATFVKTIQLVDMAAARQPGDEMTALVSAKTGRVYVNASEKGVFSDCPDCDKAAKGKATSIIKVAVQRNKDCPTCNQTSNNSTIAS
jgi:peptidoglycan/xylan/chitin deacetylase (PgdA/CDA1 family)